MDFLKKAIDVASQAVQEHQEQRRQRHDNDDGDNSRFQSEANTGSQQRQQYAEQQQRTYSDDNSQYRSQSSQGGQQQQQQQKQQYQPSAYQAPPKQTANTNPKSQTDGFTLPPQVLVIIDKYVDTFKPSVAEGIAAEIIAFEKATIESLEEHIKAAITGIFKGDFTQFQSNKNIGEFRAIRESSGANMPQYNYPSADVVASREGGDNNLPAYGSRGLPFAGKQGAQHAPQQDAEEPKKQHNIFESALSKVKDFAKDAAEDVGDSIEGEIKGMAAKIGDIADHIEEKAAQIAPEIKEKISAVLHELHLGLAELMTTAALGQLKSFLGGHISLEELGETAVDSFQDIFKGFLGHQEKEAAARQLDRDQGPGKPSGATGLLSDKLSSGLTKVRSNARGDFRTHLSKIEENLFDSLPDGLKDILSKIFGGNPFEAKSNVQRNAQPEKEGIFEEIGDKIEKIVQRIQNALRDRVLEIVSGGHRRLEDRAWGNVQDAIVGKVQQYVPGVQVHLKDDPQ